MLAGSDPQTRRKVMSVPLVYQTPLIRFLRDKSELYYGQVLELREAVELWLGYIPQTFPHYTRHTVQHSDELVVRASKLLFTDGNPTTPVVDLSAIEAYVLIAAAYLHDAGMVASDSEKQEILRSDAWRDWTSDGGGGAKRWREIQDFREGSVPLDGNVRNFIADY